MLSLRTQKTKGNLPASGFRKRHLRTAIGYSLLAVSIVTSSATLAESLGRPQVKVLQASAPAAAGTHLSPGQVHEITIGTSSKAISSQFATRTQIEHMVTRVPLASGQLIEMGDLESQSQASKASDEMTVALSEAKAPVNQLDPGDYLELIATVGSGSQATSRVVSNAAMVLGVDRTGSSLGGLGQSDVDVLLSLDNPVEAVAIAQAETAGTLVGIKVSGPSSKAFQGVFSLASPPSPNAPTSVPAGRMSASSTAATQ